MGYCHWQSGDDNGGTTFRESALVVSGYRPVEPLTVLTPLVWPNPSSGVVNLSFPTEISGPVEITIFNILGQRVYTLSESINPQENIFKFDLPLPSGSYFISVYEPEKFHTAKLTIIR